MKIYNIKLIREKIVQILVTSILLLQILQNTIYALSPYKEFFFIITLVCIFICILLLNEFKKKYIILFISIFLLSSLSILINNGGIGSVLSLTFLSSVLLIYSKVKLSKVVLKFLFPIFIIVIFAIFLNREQLYIDFYQFQKYFNVNSISLFVLCLSISSIIIHVILKLRFYYIFLFLISLISLATFYTFESNGSIISYIAFLLIILSSRLNFINIKSFFIISLFISIITPFLVNSVQALELSILSGRDIIWDYVISSVSNFTIFYGIGSDTIILNAPIDTHNNFLLIYANFGLIVTTVFYYFLYKFYSGMKLNHKNHVYIIINAAICSILLHGTIESNFSSTSIFILLLLPFLLYNSVKSDRERTIK